MRITVCFGFGGTGSYFFSGVMNGVECGFVGIGLGVPICDIEYFADLRSFLPDGTGSCHGRCCRGTSAKIELGLYIITNKDQTKTKIEILKKQAPKATYLRRLRGINWCR